jgi:hypothetical protein
MGTATTSGVFPACFGSSQTKTLADLVTEQEIIGITPPGAKVRSQDFRHSRRREFDADTEYRQARYSAPDPDSANPGSRPLPGHPSAA